LAINTTTTTNLPDYWIRGWPSILLFCGGYKHRNAVLTMVNKYGLPLRYNPSGEPVLIISEANAWLQSFSEASSPFRIRALSGAALRTSKGENMGYTRGGGTKKRDGVLTSHTTSRSASPFGVSGEIDLFDGVPHDTF
jgi:hypothetical protein